MRDLATLLAAFTVVLAIGLGATLGSRARTRIDWGPPGADGRPRFEYWQRAIPPTPEPRSSDIGRPEGPIESWPNDQLADIADPNVLQPGFVPLRLEGSAPVAGAPRLAIDGLDANGTINMGSVPISRPVQADIGLVNLGSSPLAVARVYPSISAVALRVAGSENGPSGRLEPPAAVVPGERVTLTMRLEPGRLQGPGARSVIVQLFSNDPAHERFDSGDPMSHETRFRLVFEAREWRELQRPIGAAELAIVAGEPRLWVPEIAQGSRGGNVLRLGRLSPVGPTTATVTVSNAGEGLLELDADPAPRPEGRVPRTIAQNELGPGATTTMTLTLIPPADAAPDHAVPVRREVRLHSNDPVAPDVVIVIRAVFGGEDQAPPTSTPTPSSSGSDESRYLP